MGDYPDDPQVRTITGDPEHPLGGFVTEIGDHVAAIHSAARALLEQKTAAAAPASTIRIEISVGLEPSDGTDVPHC